MNPNEVATIFGAALLVGIAIYVTKLEIEKRKEAKEERLTEKFIEKYQGHFVPNRGGYYAVEAIFRMDEDLVTIERVGKSLKEVVHLVNAEALCDLGYNSVYPIALLSVKPLRQLPPAQ